MVLTEGLVKLTLVQALDKCNSMWSDGWDVDNFWSIATNCFKRLGTAENDDAVMNFNCGLWDFLEAELTFSTSEKVIIFTDLSHWALEWLEPINQR